LKQNYAVWSEFMPYHWVLGDLSLLQRQGLALNLAIPSDQMGQPALRQLLIQAALQAVPIRAWLLLPDQQGYWPNASNAKEFALLVHRFLDWIETEKLPLPIVIADLEPCLADSQHFKQLLLQRHLPALWAHLKQSQRQAQLSNACQIYNRLIQELHQRGTQAWAVTYPLVVEDAQAGNCCFQELLQLPVSGVAWDALSLMTYRSSFRDILKLPLTASFVQNYFQDAKNCFDIPIQAALGVVGRVGKLSESGYRSPSELAADCQAVRSAGVSEIQVFSLDGMHLSLTPADWLGAMQREQADIPGHISDRAVRLLLKLSNGLLAQGGPNPIAGEAQILRSQKQLQATLARADRNMFKGLRQLVNKDWVRFFRSQR
jgi:hypothetical protein